LTSWRSGGNLRKGGTRILNGVEGFWSSQMASQAFFVAIFGELQCGNFLFYVSETLSDL